MTYQPNPNDPARASLSDDEFRRQARLNSLDNELQPDPELAESASGGKVAMFAIAIAVVLGAVFYGLNNTSVNNAGTSETTKTAQTQQVVPPAAPPGMRDVTPKANTESGTTTGAAPARPATPAAPANPDMNNSANPPADRAPAAK